MPPDAAFTSAFTSTPTFTTSVWPVLHYDDTSAALRFLTDVLGFAEAVAVSDDHGGIGHAELRRPGGEILQPPHATEFGSGARAYAFTVSDPEGNLWTFGAYRGTEAVHSEGRVR
ncbi:hypothetical protein AB0I49_23310 [Streptomyces sp. NPDC050617]|uniref:hypothetical protein n=1 Tax=Streptomyces sp. NPDC050617 TaxID=3154628 RepID=UPI00341C713D